MTRDERVNRHFQNSLREKLRELMAVMSPGEQLLWGSLNNKELLKVAKERIEEELAHENDLVEDATSPVVPAPGKAQVALALPKPIPPS